MEKKRYGWRNLMLAVLVVVTTMWVLHLGFKEREERQEKEYFKQEVERLSKRVAELEMIKKRFLVSDYTDDLRIDYYHVTLVVRVMPEENGHGKRLHMDIEGIRETIIEARVQSCNRISGCGKAAIFFPETPE